MNGVRVKWVMAKAVLLFALCNLLFAWLNPMEVLGRVSIYNMLLAGRERLPYGENPALSNSVSSDNLPALLASHRLSAAKAADEFRVLVLGDSSTWGWRLQADETTTAYLNALKLTTPDGRRVLAYNLGYPVMSLSKDLLILDAALSYQADAVLWLVTLESFPLDKQTVPSLVQHNPARMQKLLPNVVLPEPDFWARTLVGQRRALADWLRLQTYGLAWAATGIDQYIPAEYTPRQTDLDADSSWHSFKSQTTLTQADLAFDVLTAGLARAGDLPVLIVNEPMYISDGANSDLRYNSFYPRWAYDQYRVLLQSYTQAANSPRWLLLDAWDALAPQVFTDTPVHTTPDGAQALAEMIAPILSRLLGGG